MTQLKCIIVDDEPLAVDILETYVQKLHWLEHVASFENGLDALSFLDEHDVDLILLDIQMPDLTGLELARIARSKAAIIFTTAYHQFAVEGFEVEALDYLLKPISFDRFLKAVQKVKVVEPSKTKSDDYIFVKAEYKIVKIAFEDILYIEGMKDYLRIVTRQDKIMTLQSFSRLMPILPSDQFMRVHKSYVIAVKAIEMLEKGKVKVGEQFIPVGESYRAALDKLIQRRMA